MVVISEGEQAIVERVGRFHRVLKSGLNFITPHLEKVVYTGITRQQDLLFSIGELYSKDGLNLEIEIFLSYFSGLNGCFYMLQQGVPTTFADERVAGKLDAAGNQ